MKAYQIATPDRVLVLGAPDGPHLLRRSTYVRTWCGGQKRVIRARRKGLLVDVAEVRFDANEPRWRVDRDEIDRDVLVIGPRIALMHCCRDESERAMEDQLADLFDDRGWIAREAAQAAGALLKKMGFELERVPL